MKKTTVISLSIILFNLCTLQSCREDHMDLTPENNNLVEKGNQKKLDLKTKKDSLQTTENLQFDADGNEIKDPPPKDKDQWKY